MLNLNSIANYVICNGLSIIIQDIEYGMEDKIIWRWSDSDKLHKSKIYNSRQKGDYFIADKTRYYLIDFLRL